MTLRPYQLEAVEAAFRDIETHRAVMLVVATGGGKTRIAGEITSRLIQHGKRVLFLADARELVWQSAKALEAATGHTAQVEMADEHADSETAPTLTVATVQTLATRLDKWKPDAFDVIFVDECHRSSLGEQPQAIFRHFGGAKLIGLTATPFAARGKELGTFWKRISYEAGLAKLIAEGWLSRIRIRSCPLPESVDLSGLVTRGDDFTEKSVAAAIAPAVKGLARLLLDEGKSRKGVCFLPDIATSRAFVDAARDLGLRIVHVDGQDREGIAAFAAGEFDYIACSQLLSTGWDCPQVDLVAIFRPLRSFTLYSQMVGRGTRLFPGKANCLVLDPLWVSEMPLVRPAQLICRTSEEAQLVEGQEYDLAEASEKAMEEAAEQARIEKAEKFAKALREKRKRNARVIDALDLDAWNGLESVRNYQPRNELDADPADTWQLKDLADAGFDTSEGVWCKGHASVVIQALAARRRLSMATPRQVTRLKQWGHADAHRLTQSQASDIIARRLAQFKTWKQPAKRTASAT